MTPYFDDGAGIRIFHGDVLDVLRQLPAGFVQTCVTSPPYWGLRCYGTDGQLGLESTPDEFVAKMVEVFREVRRTLRDDGTIWVNLGDSYATSGSGEGQSNAAATDGEPCDGFRDRKYLNQTNPRTAVSGLKPKDLCGIPWRVALALQADGWYLRSDIVWSKPNPMPESCTDRPTKAHEYIFLLSKRAQYHYDADAIREETGGEVSWDTWQRSSGRQAPSGSLEQGVNSGFGSKEESFTHPLGRNKRTVWTVATESTKFAHFATYPKKLIEPCILAGATDRACAECGTAWKRVVEVSGGTIGQSWHDHSADSSAGMSQVSDSPGSATDEDGNTYRRIDKGFAPGCDCGTQETRPSVVLDPFMGSGTTAEVARKHGCHCVGIELNSDYIDLAARRLAQGVLEFS